MDPMLEEIWVEIFVKSILKLCVRLLPDNLYDEKVEKVRKERLITS